MKIVVAGVIDLQDPDKREQSLLDARPYIEGALTQDGCLYYAWTADFLTPGRVYVYEEWSSQEALAAHLAGPHYASMAGHLASVGLAGAVTKKFRVDLEEPVYDETGVPRADFVTAAE